MKQFLFKRVQSSLRSQTEEIALNTFGQPMVVLGLVAQGGSLGEQVVDLPCHLLALVRIRYRLQPLLQRLGFLASLARLLPQSFQCL